MNYLSYVYHALHASRYTPLSMVYPEAQLDYPVRAWVAAADGTMRSRMGQAVQFLPPKQVERAEGEGRIRLMASHNRTRIRFTHAGAAPEPPRRGPLVPYQYAASLDGHHNRTLAAAMRKGIFSYPKTRNLLILHVGSGFGTQVGAATARVACGASGASGACGARIATRPPFLAA